MVKEIKAEGFLSRGNLAGKSSLLSHGYFHSKHGIKFISYDSIKFSFMNIASENK